MGRLQGRLLAAHREGNIIVNITHRIGLVLGATAIAAGCALAAPTAAVAKSYDNCTQLNKDYKHGVSKSKSAAQKQVRAGNGMPAYGSKAQKVYAAVKSTMDRDKDGTACER